MAQMPYADRHSVNLIALARLLNERGVALPVDLCTALTVRGLSVPD